MAKHLVIALLLLIALAVLSGQPAPASKWVFAGDDGRLHYGTDARGNRIMDFSHAG